MKKQYINPSMEIVKMETQQLIAFSGDSSIPSSGDAGGAASRFLDFDEDE